MKFIALQLRTPSVLAFLVFCAGCFALSILRCVLSGTGSFLFLNWNLFLAGLPLLFSRIILYNDNITKGKILFLLPMWLLFFPNAPYILTDLFHLGNTKSMPKWFDLLMILSFAWAGLYAGFKSLQDIQRMLVKFMSEQRAMIVIALLLFTAAFGVYIGRFERWNSWDLLVHPFSVAGDVVEKFTDPFSHPRTWGVTLFLGTLLNVFWFSIRLLQAETKAVVVSKTV
ncbi:MAG TPA: DUF1361 domain-containing protein [Bacteroidia bacterium]|nr:DUF1361 domain-containing protein [Bacteroidia bacterium]